MSNSLSNWFNGILNRGSNNGSYQTLDSNPINSSSGMPGGFPGEGEAVASGNRNRFNSRNVEYYIRQAYHWAQYLIIEPVIILLILMFRLLAKVLNIVFFDGSASSANNGNDPIDKVNKFVCDLEDQLTPEQQHNQHYGDNGVIGGVLPPFYQGSYTQALYMATSRAKFLYIYLTNPQNENSSIIFQKL